MNILQALVQQIINDLPRHVSYEIVKFIRELARHPDNEETIRQAANDPAARNALVMRVASDAGIRLDLPATQPDTPRRQKKYDCPPGLPIKGTIYGSYILPGARLYSETRSKGCFATEAEAQAAGFWKAGSRRRKESPKQQSQNKSKRAGSHQHPKRIR